MNYKVPSNYDEFTLLIRVKTSKPEQIRVVVEEATMNFTVFTDRYKTVNGEVSFFVRLPITGKCLTAKIFNQRLGNIENDNSFEVTEIKRIPLEKKLDIVDFTDIQLQTFVTFCTKFCYNAGTLETGKYESGKFTIDYLQTITQNGKELTTPARIGIQSGIIQVSRAKFLRMTVPMRMAIMLHEYSHFYVNDKMESETEADLNALLVYLGLGYPRIEAYIAFLKTFENAPSESNRRRYDKINKFINDFEKHNFIVYE